MIHQSLYLAVSTETGVVYDGRNPDDYHNILRYRDSLICPHCQHKVHKYSLRLQPGVVTFKHTRANAKCPYSMETLKAAGAQRPRGPRRESNVRKALRDNLAHELEALGLDYERDPYLNGTHMTFCVPSVHLAFLVVCSWTAEAGNRCSKWNAAGYKVIVVAKDDPTIKFKVNVSDLLHDERVEPLIWSPDDGAFRYGVSRLSLSQAVYLFTCCTRYSLTRYEFAVSLQSDIKALVETFARSACLDRWIKDNEHEWHCAYSQAGIVQYVDLVDSDGATPSAAIRPGMAGFLSPREYTWTDQRQDPSAGLVGGHPRSTLVVSVDSLDALHTWLHRAKAGQWPKKWLALELAPIIDTIRFDGGYASGAIYFRFGEFPAADRDCCYLLLNGRPLKRREGFDCYDFADFME